MAFLLINGSGWSSTTTLNTLPPEARIYYQYHPYANQTFKVLQRASGKRNQVTLALCASKTLTVPEWMLQPESSLFQIDSSVVIPQQVLLELLDFLLANCSAPEPLNRPKEKPNGTKKL